MPDGAFLRCFSQFFDYFVYESLTMNAAWIWCFGELQMILPSERDLSLYERMAAELLHVAADLRKRQHELALDSSCANRLEGYASAINTNLTVELA